MHWPCGYDWTCIKSPPNVTATSEIKQFSRLAQAPKCIKIHCNWGLRSTCLDFQTTECHSDLFQSRTEPSWLPPSPSIPPDARSEKIQPHYSEHSHFSCFDVDFALPVAVGVVGPSVVFGVVVACWEASPLTPCSGCTRCCCSWQSSSSCWSCCCGRTWRCRWRPDRRWWPSLGRNRVLIFWAWGFRCG